MISLLHPSRGRPEKSYANAMEWISKAGCEVELILSLDKSDNINAYLDLYSINQFADPIALEINDNSSVVEATNHAAKRSNGDILLYLSDDFKCFDNWGVVVENEFKKYPEDKPVVLKVDDCLQKFDIAVMTIPIMNREAYQRLRYFWHPEYKSMFVDEHLYWRSKKLGFLKFAPHIKFEHQHVSVGKAENDETYRRSAANWEQGKALFAKHKAAGFVE